MRSPVPLVRFLVIFLALALSACGGRTRLDATELLPVDELYAEAKQSLDSGNYDRSIRYYKRLVARFPFGRYTEQAQLDLAFAQFKSSDSDEAFSTVNRFIKTYPTHRHIGYAFYLRGLINFDREIGLLERYIRQDNTRRDLGFARQAFKDFGELLERYPTSRYAPDARQRMVHLRNGLAQSELNVSEFYFRRKAYVAAQGRAKYIIENYQETPQSADALAILAESYRQLGEEKLSTDTRRVLELNYPDHAYLSGDWPAKVSFWRKLVPFGKS